jgi:hypothetical protein
MASEVPSFLNLLSFVIITLFYFFLKPTMMIGDLAGDLSPFINKSRLYLGIYFLAVLLVQFGLNIWAVNNRCGGDNIGTAAMYTFGPWTLIFGVMLLVLMMYPSFKTAFADVVGYFAVSSSANTILNQILINKPIQQAIDQGASNGSLPDKKATENAADLIIKIMGNTSILINQLTPTNFGEYWTLLTPLMKPGSSENGELKEQLFGLVQYRDKIGEFMWYLYTGVLLTSIVQMKIVTNGCNSSPEAMKKKHQAYLEEEKKKLAKDNVENSVEYVSNY